jgi:hypothetical protein
MSPARSDEPLRKCTLNLYEADCAFLEQHLGRGWSEHVRTLVHAYARSLQETTYQKLTVGDLAE